MPRLKIGIAFGGVSPEHEVSIITSLQAAAAMDRVLYEPVPLYLAKDGRWYTGEGMLKIESYKDLDMLLQQSVQVEIIPGGVQRMQVRELTTGGILSRNAQTWQLDLIFLGLHGGSGENGGMQGLCETMDVPYTGSGILASALAMDKVRAKEFSKMAGIAVVPSKRIREKEWAAREDNWLTRLESSLRFPLIVKPVKLGSSVGISRVSNRTELDYAIEEAFRYDEEVLVETAIEPLREINCSVLGDEDEAVASVLEEPVSHSGILSYEDKYMSQESAGKQARGSKRGDSRTGMASQDRLIPAPLPEAETEKIRAMATRIFRLFGCAGVCRIDFLMDAGSGEIYFNEINTIPGSLSFYLWVPSGISFDELVGRLIQIGLDRYKSRSNRVRSYDVNLLAEHSVRGLKGAKS